jgi:small subunit ribosomal protein S4
VYRLGFAKTRSGARQLVSHRHITVNGEILNIPSYLVKAGDVITVREKSKSLEVVTNALASKSNYEWLQFNDEKKEGTFISAPERIQIPEDIKENLIVELYSK